MNRQPFPSFSVGPQRPAKMATYHRAPMPPLFSLHGFVLGLVAGMVLNLVLRAVL